MGKNFTAILVTNVTSRDLFRLKNYQKIN